MQTRVKEVEIAFGDTGNALSGDSWYNQNNGLYEVNFAARVPSTAGNGTVSSLFKQGMRGPALFAEATSELAFGNFGNSWGVFVGARRNDTIFGGTNTGYLVRYQFNNFAPAIFRVNSAQSSEYLQIASGDPLPLKRGDSVGLQATPLADGTVLLQATYNGAIVLEYVDTNPIPLGSFCGLRMSRSAQSGPSMTGTALFVAGSVHATPDAPLGGAVGLSAALKRSVGAIRLRTVALASTLTTGALKRRSADVALAGSLDAKRASRFIAVPRIAMLNRPPWNAFLRPSAFSAQLNETPQMRASLEGNVMLAGSVEEIRIDLGFSYEDEPNLPTVADVRIGAGEWTTATIQKLSSTRCRVSVLAGPLLRGIHPVQVRFVSGLQTPILFAGNLSVY